MGITLCGMPSILSRLLLVVLLLCPTLIVSFMQPNIVFIQDKY